MFAQNYKLIHLKTVNSTNLHASALLSESVDTEPKVIVADFQSGGKGQGSNTWESEAGKNLLLSLVIYPDKIKASEQFYISKISAIAIRETLSGLLSSVKIKWPNDILVKNLKISGVLIENTLKGNKIGHSIIGVGINLNQSAFSVPATSVLNESGKKTEIPEVLNSFLEIFHYWYEIMQSRDFAQIDMEYYKNLFGFQEWLRFSWSGVEFEGFIEGVEPDGYLIIKARDGKIFKFGFREVEFLLN
ncbi:MAG: biotin--[acetyl-CoA-carboxylase] ligase [Bacteroidales bacterium]|nr:biotin--[acetyl-CoA-carboxylase] ligase [Bacteroidales bacterium]MCB9013369.1 biotin--[acetyl-CoA-carboxylase] ligase [Bacteroidales bacterium]